MTDEVRGKEHPARGGLEFEKSAAAFLSCQGSVQGPYLIPWEDPQIVFEEYVEEEESAFGGKEHNRLDSFAPPLEGVSCFNTNVVESKRQLVRLYKKRLVGDV
mmetsp:Transcript_36580/g.71942  ORF Transcript_36580/g.71942 Transcript_36580/m.71942 type:complete len:103 (+) Transcript_36580:146-454(+)